MNNLLCINIHRNASNRGIHKVEYFIYTSMADISNTNTDDQVLIEFLSAIGWDTADFEYPIVRIYNILDEEGKPVDESHIKEDMDTFIFFMNNQFKEVNYPTPPIYFTSVFDIFNFTTDNTKFEKYKTELAYECMQFELAGFFNIRAMVNSPKFIPFVYANKPAQKIYSRLINSML